MLVKNRKTNKYERRIKILQERYFRAATNKNSLLKMINEVELSEHVYNSNAIENSTLTLEETEKVLLQLDLDRYISQRELFEAKNLARVMEYIENKSQEKDLDKDVILFLHKMLISNIRDDIAGRFRNENEWVKVGNHIAVDPKMVVGEIEKLLSEYKLNKNESIIRQVAKFHLAFEYIHPFVDGNGRIGRVLNNYILLRCDHPLINLKFSDRSKYYSAFREYQKDGSTDVMEELVGLAIISAYHKRLAYLENKKIITLLEYSKIKKESHSNLLNKANRQSIEAFMEKGVWKIGIEQSYEK